MNFAPVPPLPEPNTCPEKKDDPNPYCWYDCQLDTCYLRWVKKQKEG